MQETENSTEKHAASAWTYSTAMTFQNIKKNPDLYERSEFVILDVDEELFDWVNED